MKYTVYRLEMYQDDSLDIPVESNQLQLGEIQADNAEESSIMTALDNFRVAGNDGNSSPLLPDGSSFLIVDLYGSGRWLEIYADGDENCPVCALEAVRD